ncbi:sulfatase [Rhodopirellula baltica]|uniref:N-acetylgalactosamine 6-sulfate sulfatase (GALNS) n=1 Tax=Rhodopirellula baltica SWK14 TaxID=993516 RepID=L7CFW4_RHOBT|nr:sulfatase [Rhodopirellula baltica]ELP32760.1 N-acetylgalactosamine 6-sulfate sulfatase (GALNS) [Rhodopirellula baltica SWK14]
MKLVATIVFAIAVSFFGPLKSSTAQAPNFIVFLADDLGWGDLACYGHPLIQTPHLDQFAKEGMRFTQAYSACGVCSPSRSSILTGRTPYRNGVWRWIPGGSDVHLRESEITVAELLRPRGYQTMHAGKWHLNGKFNDPAQPQPGDHGYDWWFATQNNAAPSHKNPANFVRNGEEVGRLEGFSAPLVAEEAIAWLENERDTEQPFFMTVWTHEPHLPIESDPEFMKLYSDLDDPDLRQHHGNVTQLDHAFGKLMKALDKNGLRENTFVIFTSDNGPEGRSGTRGRTRGSTGGLRGRKRDDHEGGIRVPAIVRWPGKVQAGAECPIPIIGSDIFSTVLDIANVPLPTDRTIDGVSILPTFSQQPLHRGVPLFWRTHIAPPASHAAMRIDNWKIIANEDLTKFQLYDIESDWKEQVDLAVSHPEKLAEMKAKFMEVWNGIEAEGPSECWNNAPPERTNRKRQSANLPPEQDQTGDWDVVKGGRVSASEFGYVLDAGAGEAFAVIELDEPIESSATYRLKYRAATDDVTKNACFCFGSTAENNKLFKAGTMIGMNCHGVFAGGWGNVRSGTLEKATFEPTSVFELEVTLDLVGRQAKVKIGQTTMEHPLPSTLEKVTHIGIYSKATKSEFTRPQKIR